MAAIKQRRRYFAVPRRIASRRLPARATPSAASRPRETLNGTTVEKVYAYDLRGRFAEKARFPNTSEL